MNHQIIKQIVNDVFKKAKTQSASHKPNALSRHIENQPKIGLSYKTLERAHKKYIDNKETDWSPSQESVNNFCRYLGYKDYEDYVAKHELIPKLTSPTEPLVEKLPKKNPIDRKKRLKQLLFLISIILILFFGSYYAILLFKNKNDINTKEPNVDCMAWIKDHYELIDCDSLLHNTKVIPYNASLYKNMKKVRVNAAYPFFSEIDQKPLVWYYKTKRGTIEYFTAPGLHPVNGETLKKITPGIITKYVPIHNLKPDSFLTIDETVETNKKTAILILNNDTFDNDMTTAFTSLFLKNKSHIIRLNDSKYYDREFVNRFDLEKETLLNGNKISIDTLVLGTTEYSFKKNDNPPNTITCTVSFNYRIFEKKRHKWQETFSKRKLTSGIGYSEDEAKQNAINKTNYD